MAGRYFNGAGDKLARHFEQYGLLDLLGPDLDLSDVTPEFLDSIVLYRRRSLEFGADIAQWPHNSIMPGTRAGLDGREILVR